MRRGSGKRLLSLVLAVELLCTPLAMARAEDPAQMREEIPLGEEARTAQTSEEDRLLVDTPATDTPIVSGGGDSGRDSADIGDSASMLAAPTVDNSKGLYHLGLSYGQPYVGQSITLYQGYLKQESPESEGYLNSWGYGGGNSANRSRSISRGSDGYLYFCLPDMGRVPDKTLEGVYLYAGAQNLDPGDVYASWVNDETALRSWSYDEERPEDYKKLELETVSEAETAEIVSQLRLETPTAVAYTLVRFPATQVEEDLSFVYHVPANVDEGTAEQWSIPLVARWVPSANSDMTLFALDVTDSAAGTTQAVTDLYTKPFRQATAADHIQADEGYSVTYEIQTDEDLAGNTSRAVTRTAAAFMPAAAQEEAQHYYLRVEEEQDSVTLRFLTQEPNYEYHVTENGGGVSPVTVTATFEDQAAGRVDLPFTPAADWGGDTNPFFPPSLVYGTVRNAQNSTALPARGQWTAADIPLKKVSDAADPDTDPFNTITVTIQSPDETAQSVYVFHIERLMTPQTALGYGNTPAGMIMRDNSTLWGSSQVEWGGDAADLDPGMDLAAYNKASALKYFESNRTFRDMPILPTGTRNQSGAIYKGNYSTLAWYGVSTNPDFDTSAVVAYQDMAFDDPGVSFVDSEGHKVVFGQGAASEYVGCVTRTLELRTAAALSADTYGTEGVKCWYNVDASGKPYLETDESKAAQTLRRADGSDGVDLRGLIVLPGTYTAVYTFVDPVSGDKLETRRTVVVLPIPGDVDMDGAVTAADAVQLEANMDAWESETRAAYRLLRNRVYGMTLHDGLLNAALIRQGFQPVLGDREAVGYSDYLYLPLPYSGDNDYHVRKTWDQVTDLNGNGAKLRLDFLGIEQGTWYKGNGETYTANISGPWASPATSGENTGVSIVAGDPASGTGDVFWMGVYVEDPGAMSGKIQDLSISLVYDSEYVRPAMVYSRGEGSAYTNDTTRWQLTTLLKYNFLAGSQDQSGQGRTIFSGRTGSDYDYTNSVLDRPYATHYSKVEGDLELAYTDAYGQLNSGKLKEAVYSLQSKKGGTMATMGEGYLLVLPFQLIRHPDERMGADRQAQLVELSAGMRDFSVVLDAGSGRSQGIFELFSDQPRAAAGSTYAFSAQDDIYGNTTQNIRQALTYDGTEGLVPIGKDNTRREELKVNGQDPVYDEELRIVDNRFFGGKLTAGELPPGLELDATGVSSILGTPTRVGVYNFSIDGQPYRITVKPKTIHYQAVAVNTYYGESEFRGNHKDRDPSQRNFTFTYDRVDLSQRDQEAAKALFPGWTAQGQGSGQELAAILGRAEEAGTTYTAPLFYARDPATLAPVHYRTNVGKYEIRPENVPATTNYELVYDTLEAGQLSIQARPVWIRYLDIPQERSGSRIYNDDAGTNQSLIIEEKKGEACIVLGFDESQTGPEGSRVFNGLPLTGSARVEDDFLTLRYSANYVPNQADLDYVASQGGQVAYRFLLQANEEPRPLEVARVAESFIGSNAKNYTLLGPILERSNCAVYGTVVRRGVKAIRFTRYPAVLQQNEDGTPLVQAYYGSRVNDTALFVAVTRGSGEDSDDDKTVGEYVYNNPLLRPMEIHYNWVSPEQRQAGLAEPRSLAGTNWDPSRPEGQQDLRPYNGIDMLTPDMDGYYLCAVVKEYEADLANGEEPHYIKVYSDHPVRVAKRTITLSVQPMTRYYGESNGQLRYRYAITDMIPEDGNALRAWVAQKTGSADAEPTLDGAEMENFFREVLGDAGFQAPTLEVSKTYTIPVRPENRVDQTTDVGGGEFYIILQGGQSTNYNFAYVRPVVQNNVVSANQTETVTGPGAFGFSKLTMMKRPIVISDIYSPQGTKANFETIYSDTKNLFLQNQTAGLNRVSFVLPRNDSEATYFYRYGGSASEIKLAQTYADPDGPAVVNGDDVTVRYSVRFMCDASHYRWLGFDNNYYDVTSLSDAGGTLQKDVVVADMELVGKAAANYELVYSTSEQAMQRAPSNVEPKIYPNPNHNGENTRYLIHGTGAVTLRKISSLEFQRLSPAAGMESVGQTNYTYGDNYAPYANNHISGAPMVLVLNYETAEDERHNNGDYENNVHSETLSFRTTHGTTNFAQRGLLIYYLKPGQSAQQAMEAGQTLEYTDPMLPEEHNGARLFVTGKRRAEDPTVISKLSDSALRVDKKELTFTVRDAHRFYGETLHVNDGDVITDDYIGTAAFTYSFPTAQLAQRDREELARLKGVALSALPALSTEADLKLLSDSGWPVGLITPTYTGDPGVSAGINKEQWGEYTIGITPRDIHNYKVTGIPGTLYVYPRPIDVSDVRTSAQEPVYTIYNQSSSSHFVTQLDTQKVELLRRNVFFTPNGQLIDGRNTPYTCSDRITRHLPLTGNALVGEDSLIFTVQLWFYPENGSNWDLEAGIADYAKPQVRITFREVKASEVSKNYALGNVSWVDRETFERDGFWGAVKLRTIDEIFITGKPKTQYAYGDVLDLTDLQVTIRYKALQGVGEINVVNYLGPDQFKQVGLYVNYWYPEDLVPGGRKPNATELGEKDDTTTTDQEDAQRKELPNTYRRADSGDHLTIAPTHDTQRYVGVTSTNPQERAFAANGKYIVISAFQEGDKQVAATPKILGAQIMTSAGYSYEMESAPIPLAVTPMQLRYDLSAVDKTYDGTTQAAGTLTLNNVFDANVQVKIEESDNWITGVTERVRDVVYIPMGAAYEDHGADHAAQGYNAYRSALKNGQVSFTTGAYQPGGEAPLMENGKLSWTEGYEWGKGLTFTFANPNVHYLEEGESEPRAIGTQAMADYWRASQAANDVKDRWDSYGEVCAMPVEVTGMALAGPDAANYTWAADGVAQSETDVTMTTRSAKENEQDAAPYATIHKANRSTIQTLAGQGLALPYLQLDEHTNVARLFYEQDLAALADNNNLPGSADEFRGELHFEYALYYEGKDGLLKQWAGAGGDRAYQDTTFFGGEFVQPQIDPGYVPDYSHMKTEEETKEEVTRKGQHYRWTEEDTGLSPLGHREDAGIVRALDAYPGGAENAELYYAWYYDLYTWGSEGLGRTSLPRDTVFYPLVRLSETHNYHASGSLSGDTDVTAQALDAAQKAVAKLNGAAEEEKETLTTDALDASAQVFTASQSMRQAALDLSAKRVAEDAALAAEGKIPEEERPLIGSAPAVKTFLQRLDLLSSSWERSSAEGEKTDYLVRILEDVWFTDTLVYPEMANMNAVVYNYPTRYHNYFWDPDKSAAVRFGDDEMPIDFGSVMSVAIRQRQSDGSTVEVTYTYDPDATNHTAQLYVQTSKTSGSKVRSIRIVPETVYARVGDGPYQLRVVTVPAMPIDRRYTWTTSDPSVVTVNQYGVLTFRGEGSAVITITTSNGREATATVVVSAVLPATQVKDGLFNFQYTGHWALLDGDYAFRPKLGMTRGELVTLLDLFLNPSDQWQATQELAYIDVTGREKYYDALKRLTGAGVITGIPGSTFAGDQLATRAEFATMVSRMLKLDIVDTQGMTHAFADADETSTWAYAYIDALAKAGVIRGVGGGDFAPNRVITREETAAIIARLLTTKLDLERTDLLRPSDMTPENWSYPAVLRAINTVAFPD